MARRMLAPPPPPMPTVPPHPPTSRVPLWPVVAIGSFLAVLALVVARDALHDPRPGLSGWGWLTLALTAVLLVELTARRSGRQLVLTGSGIGVAALLVAVLLAGLLVPGPGAAGTPDAKAHAKAKAKAPAQASLVGGCPEVRQGLKWLGCVWGNGKAAADRWAKAHSPTATTRGGR